MSYKLLFLCKGNYYRSRFAEILFNTLSSEVGLNWGATSRGIATETVAANAGPMFIDAIGELKSRGIKVGDNIRPPLQLQEHDLIEADLIIALHESQLRPYLEERFPDWPNKIEYWHVQDLDFVSADVALPKIEREVNDLIKRLSRK